MDINCTEDETAWVVLQQEVRAAHGDMPNAGDVHIRLTEAFGQGGWDFTQPFPAEFAFAPTGKVRYLAHGRLTVRWPGGRVQHCDGSGTDPGGFEGATSKAFILCAIGLGLGGGMDAEAAAGRPGEFGELGELANSAEARIGEWTGPSGSVPVPDGESALAYTQFAVTLSGLYADAERLVAYAQHKGRRVNPPPKKASIETMQGVVASMERTLNVTAQALRDAEAAGENGAAG